MEKAAAEPWRCSIPLRPSLGLMLSDIKDTKDSVPHCGMIPARSDALRGTVFLPKRNLEWDPAMVSVWASPKARPWGVPGGTFVFVFFSFRSALLFLLFRNVGCLNDFLG